MSQDLLIVSEPSKRRSSIAAKHFPENQLVFIQVGEAAQCRYAEILLSRIEAEQLARYLLQHSDKAR